MSETPQGPGWWLASDGRYYPPQPEPPPAPPGPPTSAVPPQPGQAWAPPTAGPAPGAPTAPGAAWGAPSSGPVPPPPGPPSAGSGGSTRAVLVVLGIVVVLVLAMVAVAAFLVAGDREERNVTADPEPLEQVPTTLPEPVDPGGGSVPGAADGGSVEVAEIGFSLGEGFDGETAANAGAVLRNVGPDAAAFFEVVFTFTDASGAAVGTETAYVYAIDPGGVAHAAVDAVSLQGAATAVDATVVLDQDGFWSGATLPVEVTEVSVDDFFGLEVSGTASNPTGSTVQGAAVNCVVRRGGKIVGGTNAMLDSIVPGGQVAWDAITFSDWLEGDAAECSGSFYE